MSALPLGCLLLAFTCVAQDSLRVQPKRLSDYDIPGLEQKFNFQATESMDVVEVIYALAHYGQLKNIVIGKGVAGQTTRLTFDDVTIGDALEVVLSVNKLAYQVNNGIITIMTEDEYAKLYGTGFYDHKNVKIVDLKYADPANVSKMLESVKSTIGTIVSDQTTGTIIIIDTPEKIGEMESIVAKADISTIKRVLPTETKTFTMQYANVEDMKAQVETLITPESGSVRADTRTKTLIVTELPHHMLKIAQLIEAFDKRPKEVFIEAKIVQVTLSEDYQMGINWNHVFQGLSPRFSLQSAMRAPMSAALGSTLESGTGYGSLTYKTIAAGGDLEVIVDALDSVGDTKILSNPHVAVMDGQEAEIATVKDQPYAEAQFESGSTNVIGESLKFVPVGVTLTVTPKINEEEFITMDIKPEISSIDGFYNAMYPIPIVKKAYATTSVMIKNGETIIIAGMIEEERRDVKNSVPFLGRIPLLGMAFRSTAESTVTSETIVFLTPRLMSGEEPVLRMRDAKKKPKPLRSTRDKKMVKPVR